MNGDQLNPIGRTAISHKSSPSVVTEKKPAGDSPTWYPWQGDLEEKVPVVQGREDRLPERIAQREQRFHQRQEDPWGPHELLVDSPTGQDHSTQRDGGTIWRLLFFLGHQIKFGEGSRRRILPVAFFHHFPEY